jgi:hypothetical protein
VAEHPNEFVRDQYVMTIAGTCQLDPDRLRMSLRNGGVRPRVRMTPERKAPQRHETPETNALRLAISDPATMLALLAPVLFDDPRMRSAFVTLREFDGDLHQAVEVADPLVGDLLSRLAVEDTDALPADVRRLLLREAGLRALKEVQTDDRMASDVAAWSQTIGWLKQRIEAIEAALPEDPPDPVNEDELLAWLVRRVEEEA